MRCYFGSLIIQLDVCACVIGVREHFVTLPALLRAFDCTANNERWLALICSAKTVTDDVKKWHHPLSLVANSASSKFSFVTYCFRSGRVSDGMKRETKLWSTSSFQIVVIHVIIFTQVKKKKRISFVCVLDGIWWTIWNPDRPLLVHDRRRKNRHAMCVQHVSRSLNGLNGLGYITCVCVCVCLCEGAMFYMCIYMPSPGR